MDTLLTLKGALVIFTYAICIQPRIKPKLTAALRQASGNAGNMNLVPCPDCGRSFSADRIAKHQRAIINGGDSNAGAISAN